MADKAPLTRTVKGESMSAKTRYFRKCVACAGQGKRVAQGNGHTVTISCTCEGGFVDCTKEIEAMRGLLEELYHGYVDSEPNYDIEPLEPFTDWLKRTKALLESMKTGVK